MRVGFASGPKSIINAINIHVCSLWHSCLIMSDVFPMQSAVANEQTSSLTQAIILKLLQSWGYDGFQKHTERVSAFYRTKRDIFERAMRAHLSGLAEWTTPEAGMFFW